MTDQEAAAFCREGWPGEGVTIRRVKSVCEVVAKDGSVLGRAFSWRPALQQAYKPKLDAEQARQAEIWEAARKDMELFGDFLREYLRKEFEEWKVKRGTTRDADSPQVRAEVAEKWGPPVVKSSMDKLREKAPRMEHVTRGEDRRQPDAGHTSPDTGRAEAGQEQLVQEPAKEQRPGPVGPPRLVLTGRE